MSFVLFAPPSQAIGQKIAQRGKVKLDGKGEILKAAMEEVPPLTAESMARRLGCGCPGVLRRNFPAQYQALLEKRTAYEKAQRKQLRSDPINALAENPALNVPAVSSAWYIYESGLLPAWGLGPRYCGRTFERAG